MKKETFVVNGISLAVTMDFEYMRMVLLAAEREWEPGRFTEAWTVEEGNVSEADYFGDIQSMKDYLLSIEQDPSRLEQHVIKVRKKKNGEFWNRSVGTIQHLNHVSEYYTEFTNSWNVLQLQLKVVDSKTCELELLYKYETL